MVEWTALEMRRTLTGTLGSNPSSSAKNGKATPKGCFSFYGFSPRGSCAPVGAQAAKPERIPVPPLRMVKQPQKVAFLFMDSHPGVLALQ